MAVNIVSLTNFNPISTNSFSIPSKIGSLSGLNGLFNHIGTDFNTVSYSNVIISNKIQLVNVTNITNINNLFDGTAAVADITTTPASFEFNTLNSDLELDITAFKLTYSSGTKPTAVRLDVSYDGGVNFITINRLTRTGSIWDTYPTQTFSLKTKEADWAKVYRLTIEEVDVVGTCSLEEFEIFGRIRDLVNGNVGKKFPVTTFKDLLNVDLDEADEDALHLRMIIYDAASDTWEQVPRGIYIPDRRVMTGNIALTSPLSSTFFTLLPNGADRQFILPDPPQVNHQFKVRNLDGSNKIDVYETSGGTLIQELSNSSGKLQIEGIFDGTEWIIIG